MKTTPIFASELITKLQEQIKKYGDIPVYFDDHVHQPQPVKLVEYTYQYPVQPQGIYLKPQ